MPGRSTKPHAPTRCGFFLGTSTWFNHFHHEVTVDRDAIFARLVCVVACGVWALPAGAQPSSPVRSENWSEASSLASLSADLQQVLGIEGKRQAAVSGNPEAGQGRTRLEGHALRGR
jgi:hypothetical protein